MSLIGIRQRLSGGVTGQRSSPVRHRVTLYTKAGCHLCEDARDTLLRVRARIPFEYEECEITSDDQLFARYQVKIPVVLIDGVERFWYRVNERRFIRELTA